MYLIFFAMRQVIISGKASCFNKTRTRFDIDYSAAYFAD